MQNDKLHQSKNLLLTGIDLLRTCESLPVPQGYPTVDYPEIDSLILFYLGQCRRLLATEASKAKQPAKQKHENDLALKCYDKSIEQHTKSKTCGSLEHANAWTGRAILFMSSGKNDDLSCALEAFQKMGQMFACHAESDLSIDHANGYKCWGLCHLKIANAKDRSSAAGDYVAAKEQFQKARMIFEKQGKKNNVWYASTLQSLVEVSLKIQTSDSQDHFLAQIMNEIEQVYEDIGVYEGRQHDRFSKLKRRLLDLALQKATEQLLEQLQLDELSINRSEAQSTDTPPLSPMRSGFHCLARGATDENRLCRGDTFRF